MGLRKQIQGQDQCWLCIYNKGDGSEGLHRLNAPRGSMVYLGNKAPLLSGMQGVRATTASTCQPLPQQALGGIPTRASTPQSVATVYAAAGNSHTPQLWPLCPSPA